MRSDLTRVGLLIVIGIVLMYLGYAFLRAQVTLRGHYPLRVHFPNVRNLSPGAQVLLAGVPVGHVDSIRLLPDRPVAEVTLAIRREIRIPEGSQFRIPGTILFPAEARVEIVSPPLYRAFIPANTIVQGSAPTDVERLIPEFQDTLLEVRKVLVATRRLLEDSQLNQSVRRTLESLAQTTTEVGKLVQSTNRVVSQNEATLHRLLQNAAQATQQLQAALERVNALLKDPRLKKDLFATLEAAKAAGERAVTMLGEMQKLVSDPQLQENIQQTASNIRTLSERLNTLSQDAGDLLREASTFTQKATEVVEDAKEVTQTAKTTFERLNKTLEAVPSIRALGLGEPLYRLDFLYDFERERYRTDTTIYFPYKQDRLFLLGLYDMSETNKFIFQYGNKIGSNWELRYGLYAAKPSIGVDYKISPQAQATLDLFNPNDVQTNLKIRFRVWENLSGWAGVEGLFRTNRPTVGIQFER